MPTQTGPPSAANKVVIAYVDGRRLKGFVYNFAPTNPRLHLFTAETASREGGTEVELKDIKAIFFVKDFSGRPDYKESFDVKPAAPGRKVEVTFNDGETLLGTTQGYDPKRLGFFIFPIDPQSNNQRIFIANQNVRHVRWA